MDKRGLCLVQDMLRIGLVGLQMILSSSLRSFGILTDKATPLLGLVKGFCCASVQLVGCYAITYHLL